MISFRMRTRAGLATGASLAALALALAATPVAAQQAPAQQQDEATTVDEIIVTAQRQAQNLQEVPLTVTALSAETAESRGVRQLDDLNVAVPGLNVSRTTGAGLPFIRGAGSNTTNPGVEPPVAFYVDGIYSPSATTNVASFNNIQRIEVLRGPQGTLFGRNTTGGIIHVVTQDPSTEVGGRVRLGYGNFDTTYGNFYVTGGLSENVAVDLSGYFSNQGEGWGNNLFDGREVHMRSDWGLRSKAMWWLGENTTLTAALDYNHTEDDAGDVRQVLPFTYGGVYTGIVAPTDPFDVNVNSPTGSEIVNWGGMFRIDHDLGALRFVSLTGYRETERETYLDLDSTEYNRSSAHYAPDFSRSWSQEFQLLSPTSSHIQWIGGLYLYTAEAGMDPLQINNIALGPQLYQRIYDEIRTQSAAVFGQATIPFNEDRTRLTLGARYTRDQKEITGRVETATTVPIPYTHRENNWANATYRLALDHHFTDDIMAYASVSTGFKSGIYNATSPSAPAVNPENVISYELGLRSELFNRRLRLNISAFQAEYDDLQLTRFTGTTSVLVNAAESEVRGVEVEGQWRATDNLVINGNVSVLDSEYTSFPGAVSFVTNPATGLGVQTVIDASGNQIMRTPELTFAIGFDYSRYTEMGEFGLNMNLYHNDGFFFDIDNQYAQEPYSIVSAEGRWISPDESYGVRLWAKNLTDELYWGNIQTQNGGPPARLPAAPRTFGVTLDYRF